MTPPQPLRAWQEAALPLICSALDAGETGILVSAIMGAGKSILIAEICRRRAGEIVVTVPSRSLVEQTSRAVAGWLGEEVGRWYTSAHERGRVTVVCDDSMGDFLGATESAPALWIVDEAHKSESPTMLASAARLASVQRVGLTATAYRADQRERLSLWERVVFRYTLADALRDGVLVPWEVRSWDGEGDASDVDGIVLRQLAAVEGPGVVGALSIDDAEAFAGTLRDAGLAALPIHSRQAKGEQRAAMAALSSGEVRALVHVDMLSEGVDLPWLRWVALRAPIGSRVRFLQTIGRALRSHPGKDRAVFLDPHDLFGSHSLAHPEALGAALDRLTGETVGEGGEPQPAEMPPARAVDALAAWTRQLRGALEAAGLTATTAGDWWRSGPPTDRQIAALRSMGRIVGEVPGDQRTAIKAAIDNAEDLSRGAASDLLTVLGVIRRDSAALRARRRETGQWSRFRWSWPIQVPAPPRDAIEALRGQGGRP